VSRKLPAPVRSVGPGGATTDATALVVQPDGGGIGWRRRTVRHKQLCLGQADRRQWRGHWSLMAGFARRVCPEAKELAARRVEGPLFGFRLAMGEKRPAIVANEVEYDVLDRLLAEAAIAAKNLNVVTMLTQRVAR
jgi:hypothetical protein